MMMWKYKYEDKVKRTIVTVKRVSFRRDEDGNKVKGVENVKETCLSPKNVPPGHPARIVYSSGLRKCWIYTDREIKGLKLVKENVECGE